MSHSPKNALMVEIIIYVFPGGEKFNIKFDSNKSFEDLRNYLFKRQIIMNKEYYFEKNGLIMNDNMILKDKGVKNHSYICAVDNNYIKICVEVNDIYNGLRTMKTYVHISDFKVIKANENKEVTVC